MFRALVRLVRFCSTAGMVAEARTDTFDAIWRKKTASLLSRLNAATASQFTLSVF